VLVGPAFSEETRRPVAFTPPNPDIDDYRETWGFRPILRILD
jgi:hypothetical protein